MSLRSFWSWLWLPTAAEIASQERYAKELDKRAVALGHRLGIFDELDGRMVPFERTHLLNVPFFEQLVQRIEDLERAAGGREHLRSLRAWVKEKGVDE